MMKNNDEWHCLAITRRAETVFLSIPVTFEDAGFSRDKNER